MGLYTYAGPRERFTLLEADWVLAPQEGMSRSVDTWSASGTLLNGVSAFATSAYRGRRISMTWPVADRKHVDWLEKIDRLCVNRQTYVWVWDRSMVNVISPLIGYPALHATTYSPYAWSDKGEQRAIVGPDDSLERFTAQGFVDDYDECFIVPAGYSYDVHFDAIDGKQPEVWVYNNNQWSYFNMTTPKLAQGISSSHRLNFVRYGGGRNATGRQSRGRVNIKAQGELSLASPIADTPPQGYCRLKPVPGSLEVSLHSAPLDWYSASIELQEVWPWL